MNSLIDDGSFWIGMNYWASHAGTQMWSKWDANIVDEDLRKLSESKVKVLRVYPLWSDFQPITSHYGIGMIINEIRNGEEPLADDEAGRCGIDIVAIEHFDELTKLAEKYNMKLIVGLITGWMSGRLFMPPALDGKNAITDAEVIKWEIRFVDYFVKRFKDASSIIAWDLGNECNCMSNNEITREQAWVWSATISNAIRANDSQRPVISGMDALKAEGVWTIQDQAETTDILTTHPYHIFHSNIDPINTMRPLIHPTSEVVLYRGIGNKPCFVEEIGAIGYMNVSEKVESEYLRGLLFSLWAHNCHGLMWWCAFDQGELTQTPYDWNSIGSDYGFYRADGSSKMVVEEAKKFNSFIENLPFEKLPSRIVDAICIIPKGLGDSISKIALNTFALAKQANMDIEFQYADQPLKDAPIYILPSIAGTSSMSRRRLIPLLEKVKDGAILYMSLDACLIRWLPELTGIIVSARERYDGNDIITLSDNDKQIKFSLKGPYRYQAENVTGEVIGTDQDGRPTFVCNGYGKGKIFCLTSPIEKYLSEKCGAFHYDDADHYCEIYRLIKGGVPTQKVAECNDLQICLTEHIVDDNCHIVIAINYSAKPRSAELKLNNEWYVSECIHGKYSEPMVNIQQNDAAVLRIVRKI